MTFPLVKAKTPPVSNYMMQPRVPGVMALQWVPTVGYSQSPTDPASQVARELYGKVREAYSGKLYADPPDFLIYLMALDSAFSYIAMMKRIYRALIAFSPENFETPWRLLNALGFSKAQIQDLQANRKQFMEFTNLLIQMSAKLKCPAVFDIFNRHYWLNDNVYGDDNSSNCQFYVFRQMGWYKFEMVDDPTGKVKVGGLTMQYPSYPQTGVAEAIYYFGVQLVDALCASEDAYTISGYLARAYEGQPQFTIDLLTGTEEMEVFFEPEVLSQIENALPIPGGSALQKLSNNISQDPSTNAIICDPSFSGNLPSYYGWMKNFEVENFISIRADAPTVADNVIATRLKMQVQNIEITSATQPIMAYDIRCGSEILTDIKLYYETELAGVVQEYQESIGRYINILPNLGENDGSETAVMAAFAMQQWDWHPIIPVTYWNQAEGDTSQFLVQLSGDIHNITVVSNEDLALLNRVCLYSLFNAFSLL